MSLGERFRAAREQRGLTLSDAAEHLRIRSVYLAAIEEENWPAIGAPVYTRGFLRTYARYLNLDPEEAVADYNAASGAPGAAAGLAGGSAPARSLRSEAPTSMKWLLWVAGVVALGLIGFVIYLYLTPPGGRSSQTLAGAAASPAPGATATGSPSPSPSPTPSQAHTLVMVLTAPSWLRVTVDGNVSIEGTFPAGTTKSFHGSSAQVRVGNAGGVSITVDGRPVGKLGGAGDVVEKSFVL